MILGLLWAGHTTCCHNRSDASNNVQCSPTRRGITALVDTAGPGGVLASGEDDEEDVEESEAKRSQGREGGERAALAKAAGCSSEGMSTLSVCQTRSPPSLLRVHNAPCTRSLSRIHTAPLAA